MSIIFPQNIVNPSYPFGIENEDTSLISKFEDGSMQSRRKFTRSRKKFSLKWNKLNQEEFETLNDFIVNVAKFSCNSFEWINPSDNKIYIVRCTSYPKVELTDVNFWSVTLEFTEV